MGAHTALECSFPSSVFGLAGNVQKPGFKKKFKNLLSEQRSFRQPFQFLEHQMSFVIFLTKTFISFTNRSLKLRFFGVQKLQKQMIFTSSVIYVDYHH